MIGEVSRKTEGEAKRIWSKIADQKPPLNRRGCNISADAGQSPAKASVDEKRRLYTRTTPEQSMALVPVRWNSGLEKVR